MAAPLTPERFLAILRAEGVPLVETPGWREAGRDLATGKTFGPVHMVLNHHTGGNDDLRVITTSGAPNLPPPLAHIWLSRTGTAYLCSARRANHAGLMAVNAYESFLDEDERHPNPSKASGTVDGNDVAYGIETENKGDGVQTYPRAQYDTWVRINAALCREYKWSKDSCGLHKETSVEGKPDPRGPVEGYGTRGRFDFTGQQFRADIGERLKHPASWSPQSGPPPPVTKTLEQRVASLEGRVTKLEGSSD